jgi:hypothetical protein
MATEVHDLELEPVSAAVLASLEHERRERVAGKGRCGVGCAEIDERVLLGGLERGAVVGVSSEEEEFGVLVRSFPSAGWVCSHVPSRVSLYLTRTSQATKSYHMHSLFLGTAPSYLGCTSTKPGDTIEMP